MKINNKAPQLSSIFKLLITNCSFSPWILTPNLDIPNLFFINYANSLGIYFDPNDSGVNTYDTILIDEEDYFLFLLSVT